MLLLYSVRESTYVQLEVRRTDNSFSFLLVFFSFFSFFFVFSRFFSFFLVFSRFFRFERFKCKTCRAGDESKYVNERIPDVVSQKLEIVPYVAEIGDNGKCVPIYSMRHID